MAKQSLNTIKNWFKTGLKPSQTQFWDVWDSFWHKDQAIPAESIEGLDAILTGKASTEYVDNLLAGAIIFEIKDFASASHPSFENYNIDYAPKYGQYPRIRLLTTYIDEIGINHRTERQETPDIEMLDGLINRIVYDLPIEETGFLIISK